MRKTASFLLLASLFVLGGCQAIFTYSPLSGLQRDPASMSPAQRLTYAQNALDSGDATAMQKAYDAIKNDTSAAAQYTAALLGIELSGVPTLLRQSVSNPSNVTTDLNGIQAFIANNNLQPALMVAAYGQLANAAAAGQVLAPMDYVMGSMGFLLGNTGGTWDITHATAGSGAAAQAILAQANIASLPSGDLKTFLTDYNTYLGMLP
ncbi:MAG: hypothetical protein ABSG21_17090 [Spirochaetia bacterium]